jgi:hypothetical protein
MLVMLEVLVQVVVVKVITKIMEIILVLVILLQLLHHKAIMVVQQLHKVQEEQRLAVVAEEQGVLEAAAEHKTVKVHLLMVAVAVAVVLQALQEFQLITLVAVEHLATLTMAVL